MCISYLYKKNNLLLVWKYAIFVSKDVKTEILSLK